MISKLFTISSYCVQATWTLKFAHVNTWTNEIHCQTIYIGELWSAESGLGFTTFGNVNDGLLQEAFIDFYKDGPIRKVPDT